MEHRRGFSSVAALVMARAAWRLAVRSGDLGLGKAARNLEARALGAIRRGRSNLPADTSPSAEQALFHNSAPSAPSENSAKSSKKPVRLPTPSEMDAMADLAAERGMQEAVERLKGKQST